MNALENLLGGLREVCAGLPDRRKAPGSGGYPMADIGLSAFALFFMGSPSFLAHQRRLEHGHGRSTCQSLFAIAKSPSDNHIRDMLDPAAPALLDPAFDDVPSTLEEMPEAVAEFPSPWRPCADRA